MKISIIIPTLNEVGRIGERVREVRRQPIDTDVIVVDGGSTDATRDEAEAAGAKVLTSAPGRGRQIAFGARAADGDVLLFLHADTELGVTSLAKIERVLGDPDVLGGNFRVVFEGDSEFARWLTGFYAWFRRKGLYYGDSAVFVRREAYDRLGGMRSLDLMEDFEFNRRLEHLGRTVCIADPPVVTSSRRFEGRRPAAIFLQWCTLHALFYFGASSRWLARLYDSRRERRPQAGSPS